MTRPPDVRTAEFSGIAESDLSGDGVHRHRRLAEEERRSSLADPVARGAEPLTKLGELPPQGAFCDMQTFCGIGHCHWAAQVLGQQRLDRNGDIRKWSLEIEQAADDTYFQWRDGRPDLYLSTFNRDFHNLIGLGYIEINSSAYTVFDHVSNLVAQYLHDQEHAKDRAAEFDRLIAGDRPKLNGGINFLDSARHRSYVDARTYLRYLAEVRKRMGWQDLTAGMFDGLRAAADNDAVLA